MPVDTARQNKQAKWAMSEAENRNLYKPEPARKHLKEEERYLLTFYRKLRQKERLQVALLANDLALALIRARLTKERRRSCDARAGKE